MQWVFTSLETMLKQPVMSYRASISHLQPLKLGLLDGEHRAASFTVSSHFLIRRPCISWAEPSPLSWKVKPWWTLTFLEIIGQRSLKLTPFTPKFYLSGNYRGQRSLKLTPFTSEILRVTKVSGFLCSVVSILNQTRVNRMAKLLSLLVFLSVAVLYSRGEQNSQFSEGWVLFRICSIHVFVCLCRCLYQPKCDQWDVLH